MNLRELKGTALGSCSFCDRFAACDVFARSDGAELLVCGRETCQDRLAHLNGTVHKHRERSLMDMRQAQGRDPHTSTEL